MLGLSRKKSESILIGGNIRVTVVRIDSKSVRLGIEAPPNVVVLRKEMVDGNSVDE